MIFKARTHALEKRPMIEAYSAFLFQEHDQLLQALSLMWEKAQLLLSLNADLQGARILAGLGAMEFFCLPREL